MRNQTAETIYLHSDQGRNFESTILAETCKAFGIKKSHTTPYHPQGDGLVERSNRSVLQMLRTYVTKEEDWEQYLPLLLYAYRTSQHSSTKFSPYFLMFGKEPKSLLTSDSPPGYDANTYGSQLTMKLAKLFDLVDSNLTEAADRQKKGYDSSTQKRVSFHKEDHIWLSDPTARKLSPRWESGWKVASEPKINSPVLKIQHNDGRHRTVHINRVRLHHIRPNSVFCKNISRHQLKWIPPGIEHFVEDSKDPPTGRPPRFRRPPDRYGFS
jgi:hypothetical protein